MSVPTRRRPSIRDARCLKMGSLSLAPCMPRYPEDGALCITFSSVSVALSRLLPGPAVPGFQNWRDVICRGGRVAKLGSVFGLEALARVHKHAQIQQGGAQWQRALSKPELGPPQFSTVTSVSDTAHRATSTTCPSVKVWILISVLLLHMLMHMFPSLEQVLPTGFRSVPYSPQKAAQELTTSGSFDGSFLYVRLCLTYLVFMS